MKIKSNENMLVVASEYIYSLKIYEATSWDKAS